MQIVLLALLFQSGLPVAADLPNPLAPRALVPTQFHVAAGGAIEMEIQPTGAGPLAAIRWPESEIGWFFHRSDGKQTNRDSVAVSTPGGNRAALTMSDAGVSMLGVQFKPRTVTLDGKQADDLRRRFAQPAGADRSPARTPAKGERVRVQSTANALVHVESNAAAADDPSAIATSKSGQKAEIRPMFDPTHRKAGDELPVRVYADGDKAPGAAVSAVAPDGKRIPGAANPAGFATIAITAPGVWRIELEHLTLAKDDPDADWVLYLSSLTFQTADAGAAGQGGSR